MQVMRANAAQTSAALGTSGCPTIRTGESAVLGEIARHAETLRSASPGCGPGGRGFESRRSPLRDSLQTVSAPSREVLRGAAAERYVRYYVYEQDPPSFPPNPVVDPFPSAEAGFEYLDNVRF
jgi:hypothetical protein